MQRSLNGTPWRSRRRRYSSFKIQYRAQLADLVEMIIIEAEARRQETGIQPLGSAAILPGTSWDTLWVWLLLCT